MLGQPSEMQNALLRQMAVKAEAERLRREAVARDALKPRPEPAPLPENPRGVDAINGEALRLGAEMRSLAGDTSLRAEARRMELRSGMARLSAEYAQSIHADPIQSERVEAAAHLQVAEGIKAQRQAEEEARRKAAALVTQAVQDAGGMASVNPVERIRFGIEAQRPFGRTAVC